MRPAAAAVGRARRREVAADPDGVARRVRADPPGPSGCTSTGAWQMFMSRMTDAPVTGFVGHLGRVDAVGDPGLSAVRGAVDVPHRAVGLGARVRVDHAVAGHGHPQRGAAVEREHVARVGDRGPGRSEIGGQIQRGRPVRTAGRRWPRDRAAPRRASRRSSARCSTPTGRRMWERRCTSAPSSAERYRPLSVATKTMSRLVLVSTFTSRTETALPSSIIGLPADAAVLRLHHRAADQDLVVGIAEAEVERVRIAAEGHRAAARRRQVVGQRRPRRLARLPVVGAPQAAAGRQEVDDVGIRGVRQDGARAAAVAYVAGEAAVLLVVGVRRDRC